MPQKTQFDYNGIKSQGRRKAPAARTRHEDEMLKPRDRSKMTGTIRDQVRNLSLVAWVIRKHVDYITDFVPHIRTGSDDLNKRLYNLFEWHGRKENFDIAKRHSRKRFLRLWEMHRVKDGDCLAVMLSTGQLQAIEGDRITAQNVDFSATHKTQPRVEPNGLDLDKYGAIKRFCICVRKQSQLVFSHMEQARNCIFDGYFQRFDQTRGVSPLSTAITTFQDLYEGWDYTLLKIKLHALFGIAITQHLDEEDTGINDDDTGSDEFEEAASTGQANVGENEMNFSDGPALVRLEPGEDVKAIESQTPNSGMMEFSDIMVRVALLALDIPFTFYNSLKSSFSARIIDRTEYEESCRHKREDIKSFLNQYSAWKLSNWAKIPEVATMMKEAGVSLIDLYTMVEWIPAGQPWYDPKNQIDAELTAVAGGIQSRQRIMRGKGADWWKIAAELEEEEREIERLGLTVSIGQPGAAIMNESKEEPAATEPADEGAANE